MIESERERKAGETTTEGEGGKKLREKWINERERNCVPERMNECTDR